MLGPPIHPALAFITRTTGISEWVLHETGQSVGCEVGGVTRIWQGLLGCDESGRELDMGAGREFWEGWEERLAAEEMN